MRFYWVYIEHCVNTQPWFQFCSQQEVFSSSLDFYLGTLEPFLNEDLFYCLGGRKFIHPCWWGEVVLQWVFFLSKDSHLFRGKLWNWVFQCVLAHFNFLGKTMKYCGWMAAIYASQAATMQSWSSLSSHSVETCWLWGLFFFLKRINS